MSDFVSNTFREFRRKSLWLASLTPVFSVVWYVRGLIFLAFAGFLVAILLRTFADWFEKYTRIRAVLVALKQRPHKALYVIFLHLIIDALESCILTPLLQ
jgi:predicted PurR-regulated permease PerM